MSMPENGEPEPATAPERESADSEVQASSSAADLTPSLPAIDVQARTSAATPGAVDPRVVGVSVAGHLLLLFIVIGSIASVTTAPEVIPVTFVPDDPTPKEERPKLPEEAKGGAAEQAPKGEEAAAAKGQPPEKQEPAADDAAKHSAEKAAGEKPPEADAARAPSPNPAPAANSPGFADFSLPPPVAPDLLATVRAQIVPCWSPPTGWTEPRQASVTVRLGLNRDGSLAGPPAVVEFRASAMGKAAADAALAAIAACAPFKLPAGEYDRWKDIQIELAP